MTKREIDRLQREVRELFDELWQVPRFTGAPQLRPQVDCYHTDEPHELTVVVELPGVDPEQVHIVATERELLIAGERKRPPLEGRVFQQMEIDYGAFERTIPLIEEVDPRARERLLRARAPDDRPARRGAAAHRAPSTCRSR